MNQATAVNNITKAINDLIIVIKKENELLASPYIPSMRDVIEEKFEALVKFNQAQVVVDDYIKQGLKFDKNYPPVVKLVELFGVLNRLSERNDLLIRSNLEVNNIIIEIYKESKARETLRQFGYNKEGKVSVAGKIEKVTPAIGFNNKI